MKKKCLLILFATLGSYFSIQAQVGINTEKPKSYLDVDGTAGGILAPRLSNKQRDAIVKPETGLMIFNNEELTMQQNVGTPDTPKWTGLGGGGDASWFHMPVTPIEVTLPDKVYSVDLYKAYSDQFKGATLPVGVPTTILPTIYAVDQLDYIILGYDKEVFSDVAITEKGILTYKATPTNVTDATYFNVIFKIK